MRKLIYGGLFLATAGILMVSCNKENLKPQSSSNSTLSSNQKINNGNSQFDGEFQLGNEGRFLIFNSENGYEHAVDNPSDEVRQNLKTRINVLNHYSWKDYAEDHPNLGYDTLIKDEYFASILSDEKTIQIGQNIFKVNPENETVYALHVKDKKHYTDLINNNGNSPFIKTFSFNENVLEAIKIIGGDPTPPALFCNESHASNPDWVDVTWSAYEPYTATVPNSNEQYVRRYRRECKMNYLKLGIYFNLQAKLEVVGYVSVSASSTGTYGISSFQTMNCVTSIRSKRIYKIRCQAETGWNSVFSTLTNGSNIHKTEYNSYQGSKGLNKFWLKCGFYYRTNANNSDISVYSNNLVGETLYQREIKSGY